MSDDLIIGPPLIPPQGPQGPNETPTDPSDPNVEVLTPTDILNKEAHEIDAILRKLSSEDVEALFEDLSLAALLLLNSKLQYARKSNELGGVEDALVQINDDINFVNDKVAQAREEGNDDKDHYWTEREMELIREHASEGEDIKFGSYDDKKGKWKMDSSTATEMLSNTSKKLTEDAKIISADASKFRSELNTFVETFSAIVKTIKTAIERNFGSM